MGTNSKQEWAQLGLWTGGYEALSLRFDIHLQGCRDSAEYWFQIATHPQDDPLVIVGGSRYPWRRESSELLTRFSMDLQHAGRLLDPFG